MLPASQQVHSRIVQSRQNSRVRELRASLASSGRPESGLVGIEGEHLLAEAIRSKLQIASVFFRTGHAALLERIGLDPSADVIELPADIFSSAVTTESPQGIAALIVPPVFTFEDTFGERLKGKAPLVVVAAGLQDPGNLGTLVRSAEAFGASGVVLLPGTVSLWNAKALRASSGSAFRLPVVSAGEHETLAGLRAAGVQILAAVAEEGIAAASLDLSGPVALLIGNEGRGLSEQLLNRTDERVTIPCPGPVESLNAAVAASILLYEAYRQRGLAP